MPTKLNKNNVLSRTQGFDREVAVKNAGGSQFDLVLLAAARSRRMLEDAKKAGHKKHIYASMDALMEIQAGKFND